MRTEAHSVIGNLAQGGKAKHLIAAGIGEYRSVPGHEFMKSAKFADRFMARAKIQMVGISENNLRAEFFERFVAQRLHGSLCAHRHEERSIDRATGSVQDSASGSACIGSGNFEGEVHS